MEPYLPQPLPTVGEIARQLDVPLHRVEYIIRSRNLRPIGKAGNARVFSAETVRRISAELERSLHKEQPEVLR